MGKEKINYRSLSDKKKQLVDEVSRLEKLKFDDKYSMEQKQVYKEQEKNIWDKWHFYNNLIKEFKKTK